MNIIDTITAGFDTVRKNPWLLLVPILLDLLLWFGPKLSIAPIVSESIAAMEKRQVLGTDQRELEAALAALPDFDPNILQETAGRINLLGLLAWNVLGVPSVAATRLIQPTDALVIDLSSSCAALGIMALILVIGLFLAAFFLALVGRAVRSDNEPLRDLIRQLPRYALYIVIVMAPILFATMIGISMSVICGPFSFLLLGGALWLALYLYFAPEAITMSRAGPLEAVRNSIILLRMSFWPTLGFIVLCSVIAAGVSVIWQALLTSPLGTAVAIPFNSIIGTGLAAAAFIYYRDRLSLWHQIIAQARSRSQSEDSTSHD